MLYDPIQLTLGFTNRPHLVLIDEATLYDVPTSMVQLATRIKSGEYGQIRNAVLILQSKTDDGEVKFHLFHHGTGNQETALMLLKQAEMRILGVK
jgi:hypothetical protein